MSTTIFCIFIRPAWAKERSLRLSAVALGIALASVLSACGGSGGGDAGDIAQDGLDDPLLVIPSIPQDDPLQDELLEAELAQVDESCIADIDIAEFVLTESNRQWSCEVSSVVGTRFDELYFDRNGTANFASTGIWYWNRNLPADEINLASPAEPSTLITDIGSSNSVLVFRTVNEEGVEEIYDCVLAERQFMTRL